MSYTENIQQLQQFIIERENIRLRKEVGDPRPWTTDPILAAKSFCNVRREDDRGTKWLATNWQEPHKDDPDFWFAAAVYRRGCNKERTAEAIGYPVPWDQTAGDRYEAAVTEHGYSKAYLLVVGGASKGMTLQHAIRTLVLDGLWKNRDYYRPVKGDTLAGFTRRLSKQENPLLRMSSNSIGSFVAAQITADVKFTPAVRGASDFNSFALPGPGSTRGLNRVFEFPLETKYSSPVQEREWLGMLHSIRRAGGGLRVEIYKDNPQFNYSAADQKADVLGGRARDAEQLAINLAKHDAGMSKAEFQALPSSEQAALARVFDDRYQIAVIREQIKLLKPRSMILLGINQGTNPGEIATTVLPYGMEGHPDLVFEQMLGQFDVWALFSEIDDVNYQILTREPLTKEQEDHFTKVWTDELKKLRSFN